MEEGVFRGPFTKILEGISYRKSLFFIAFPFGIWHLAMPSEIIFKENRHLKSYYHGDWLCYPSGNDEH